jgi:hypothetical protein
LADQNVKQCNQYPGRERPLPPAEYRVQTAKVLSDQRQKRNVRHEGMSQTEVEWVHGQSETTEQCDPSIAADLPKQQVERDDTAPPSARVENRGAVNEKPNGRQNSAPQ